MNLIGIDKLKSHIDYAGNWEGKQQGLIFVFGDAFFSRLIQLKTRLDDDEIVPNHVAMYYDGYLYESTSSPREVGNKTIPAGVRRWKLSEYFNSELEDNNEYYVVPCELDQEVLEEHIHRPYGKDIILDFLLTNDSDGDSDGLICSQYANMASKIIRTDPAPTPAELFRACRFKIGDHS